MAGSSYSHTTRSTGLVLTASIYNSDHTNHITSLTPATMDDYSATVAEMKTQTDPYPASSASQPTSMAGELARLRYQIDQIIGAASGFWYDDVPSDLTTLNSAVGADQKYNLIRNGTLEYWSAGTAVAPDGWTLTGASAAAAREGTTIKMGTYSAKLTRAGADATLEQNIITNNPNLSIAYFQGEKVAAKAQVWADTASRVKITIYDGVGSTSSSFHTGGSSWEELSVVHTLNGSATELTIKLEVVTGNADGFIDNAILIHGATAPNFAPHPSDEIVPVIDPQGTPTANQLYKSSIVKAWINFVGTGTIATNDSFNVSSITDNGAGNYTITWDKDFADANYAVAGMRRDDDGAGHQGWVGIDETGALQAGSARIVTTDGAGASRDAPVVTLIAIGKQ